MDGRRQTGGKRVVKMLWKNRWLLLALRVAVGGVFVYAGVTKIGDPLAFADSIATFQVFPPQLINLVALTLPPFEILVGVLLIFGAFLRQAAFALTLLTMLFAVFLFQAIVRGIQVNCGCFGSGEPSVLGTWISLGRDLLLLVAAIWLRVCTKFGQFVRSGSLL